LRGVRSWYVKETYETKKEEIAIQQGGHPGGGSQEGEKLELLR